MAKTLTPAKTPTVAIARVLRSLGLKQGSDFSVKGEYKDGERMGTRVAVPAGPAIKVVAENADTIERLAAETGFHFNVSIHFSPSGNMWVHVANFGQRIRQTHFLSDIGRTAEASTEQPEAPARTMGEYLAERRAKTLPGVTLKAAVEHVVLDFPEGQRVQGPDNKGVTCMGTVNGAGWGAVINPNHPNYGRTWVDVTWDRMPHNVGVNRERPFTSDLIKR